MTDDNCTILTEIKKYASPRQITSFLSGLFSADGFINTYLKRNIFFYIFTYVTDKYNTRYSKIT